MHPFIDKNEFLRAFEINSIVLSSIEFDIRCFAQSLFSELVIDCPENLVRATEKRRAEFLAGRYAARAALRKLEVTPENIPIDKHRAPIWPEAVVASITHTDNIAICAAAYSESNRFLGIDLETILSAKIIEEIKPSIINQQEESLLQGIAIPFETAFTLVFSAKESLFKALYYHAGRYLDFDAAEIVSVCTATQSFFLRLTKNWSPNFKTGTEVRGRYYVKNEKLFTCVFEEQGNN